MVISIEVGRELSLETKEDVTNREEKEQIICHGSDDNIVSSGAGVVMVSDVNKEVTSEIVGIP